MITVKKCIGSRCGYAVLSNGIEVDRKASKGDAIESGRILAKKYFMTWGGFVAAKKKRTTPSVERSLFTGRHK